YANGRTLQQDRQELRFPEFFDSKQQVRFDEIDLNKIKEITNLVETSNIDEINLEIEGVKISINKHPKTSKEAASGQYNASGAEPPAAPAPSSLPAVNDLNENNLPAGIIEIKSPIVGTFYRAPSPGAVPFVETGSKIKKGDTLCIIEAMKLMNKINSEHDGIIYEITVNNEDTVEYDQVIMKIKI
ncbi:MAG: acetyl-CoA carboxylase biotin carboxyl carrier protein, partial [Actinobacteria bacterium]|nr:acetyl-CoA carboxylase biotin carboxyl carrier protein [Actinomycetota bacterium]